MVRVSSLLLGALALGPGRFVEGFEGCGTPAAQTACANAENAVASDTTATIEKKCQAVATYIECMTPSGTCNDENQKQAALNIVTGFKKEVCVTPGTNRCKDEPACIQTTTTVTPWDSSASSGDSGSGESLESSYSASLYTGSSGSDSSGSAAERSSGSKASGSSGSALELWQWALLLTLCCLCCICAGVAAMMMNKKKPKKKDPPRPPPMPEPVEPVPQYVPEPEPPRLEPLVEPALEPLVPAMVPMVPTSSTIIPSYTPTTSYMQPQATSYAYAQPTTAYAAPMTYAAPQSYAAPRTYAAPYGGVV